LIYATKVALALVLSAGVALIFIVTGWSSWT
jgi:hypothetical protein